MSIRTNMRGPSRPSAATGGRVIGTILLGAMVLGVAASPAHAASQTASGTGTIKVVVPNQCTLAVSGKWTLPATLQSGGQIPDTYSASDATLDVQCTGDASMQLNIPYNGNVSGGSRRMTDGASHYIPYTLIDRNANTPLDNGGQTTALYYDSANSVFYYNGGPNDGSSVMIGVHVAAQAAPPPGSYSDTLTLSVTY
jgi:spore coat protein U-like protein